MLGDRERRSAHRKEAPDPLGDAGGDLSRETDWASQDAANIARELHRCDELALRADRAEGIRQQICLRLVMSSAAHLLSLVDARAAHADETLVAEALSSPAAIVSLS